MEYSELCVESTEPDVAANEASHFQGDPAADDAFRAVFDHSPIATVVTDCGGTIREINGAFACLLGYTRRETLGMRVGDITHPDDVGATVAAIEALRDRSAGRQRYEKRYRHKNGSWVPVRIDVGYVHFQGADCLIGQIIDLTELRSAQARIESLADRLAFASTAAGAGAWDCDLTGGEMVWDATAREQYGIAEATPTPNLETWIAEYVDASDRPRVANAIATAVQPGGGHFDQEFRIRKGTTTRWIHAFGRVARSADGHAVRATGISLDTTAQAEARRSVKLLATLLAASSDAIVTTTLDRRISTFNAAAANLLGLGTDALTGAALDSVLVEEQRDRILDLFAQVAAGKASGRTELTLSRRDGARVDTEMVLSPVLGPTGSIEAAVAVFRDETWRRQAQRELLRREAELREAQRVGHFGSWELDPETGKVDWSAEVYQIFGMDPTVAAPRFHERLLSQESDTRMRRAVQRAATDGIPYKEDLAFEHPILGGRWICASGEPIRNHRGSVVRLHGTVQDITDRKRQEEDLLRVNRALQALSRVNAALVRAQTEEELYELMTSAIVEHGGYTVACVGLVEPGTRNVRIRVSAGAVGPASCICRVAEGDSGRGITDRCLRTGQAQVSATIAEDPEMLPWREIAAAAGLRSAASLPLAGNGQVFGVLEIYSAQVDAFEESEITLLGQLANDLAFGISTLRLRREHELGAERLERSMEATIQALANTVELRDPYTAGHQSRVANLAVVTGRRLGLSADRLRGLRLAASIHDIGKLCVPAELLAKPGRLSPVELAVIKMHASAGAEILKDIEFPWPIREMVWQHHERFDGSGYPRGLKGADLLLESQIIGAADMVEAIASNRPYRVGRGIEAAIAELGKGSGSMFDPRVVEACIEVLRIDGIPGGCSP